MSGKGCWVWRRCALTPLSSLAYPSWKPTTVPVLWLTLLVIYGLADKLHRFVASIFIPQYHYPYVVALCFLQVVVSLLLLNLLHMLNLVPLKRYSRAMGERLLVSAVCGSSQRVLAMWAQANSPADGGLFPFAVCLQPLATAGWSQALRAAKRPSSHVVAPLALLSGATVGLTGMQTEVSGAHPLEYLYAPLSLFLQGLTLAWLAKVSEGRRHHLQHPHPQASSVDLYYTHLVNQSWVLGLLWLLHPDGPWRALRAGSWCCLLFHGYLLALLLLGALLCFAVNFTALRCSPVGAALLSGARAQAGALTYFLYFGS